MNNKRQTNELLNQQTDSSKPNKIHNNSKNKHTVQEPFKHNRTKLDIKQNKTLDSRIRIQKHYKLQMLPDPNALYREANYRRLYPNKPR